MLFASKMDGLFKSSGTSFQSLVPRKQLPSSPGTSIAETPAHDIWLGTADAGLMHVRGSTVESAPQTAKPTGNVSAQRI